MPVPFRTAQPHDHAGSLQPDAFFLIDRAGRILLANRPAGPGTASAPTHVVGRHLWDVPVDAVCSLCADRLCDAMEHGEPAAFEAFHAPGGRWYAVRAYPCNEGLAVFYLDVTAARKAATDLRDADSRKLDAITRMAGAVAHELNNFLTIVSGVGDLMAVDLCDPPRLQEDVDAIRMAGSRTGVLAQKLLLISQGQFVQPELLDVNATLRTVAAELRGACQPATRMVLELGDGLDRVRFDPHGLQHVLRNLVQNALDAMPRGGTLTLRSEVAYLRPDDVRVLPKHLAPGRHVVLCVGDTGTGIDEAIGRRLFEPFVSTRPRGPTAGLGLATSLGLLEQAGGAIGYETRRGAGTTFRVYLPACPEPERWRPNPLEAATVPSGSVVTVLLVEDDPVVRRLAALTLQRAGLRVIEAADGALGLAEFRDHAHAVDLLVTDVVMPHLGGVQLAEAVGRLRSDLPVLFMSGYTDETLGPHLQPGRREFLAKPYTATTLDQAVRRLLAANGVTVGLQAKVSGGG